MNQDGKNAYMVSLALLLLVFDMRRVFRAGEGGDLMLGMMMLRLCVDEAGVLVTTT